MSASKDLTLVTHYIVCLGMDTLGSDNSQVGADIPFGTYQMNMPADAAMASFTRVVAYANTSFAEQTSPASGSLSDTASTVARIALADKDRDSGSLGAP